MAAEAPSSGECLPLDGRVGAIEDAEDSVFLLHDFLQRCGGEDKEALKFAKVQQAHQRIGVSGGEKDAADGRSRCGVAVRC